MKFWNRHWANKIYKFDQGQGYRNLRIKGQTFGGEYMIGDIPRGYELWWSWNFYHISVPISPGIHNSLHWLQAPSKDIVPIPQKCFPIFRTS